MHKISELNLVRSPIYNCDISDFDEKYQLLSPGNVTVLGGRPGMGKSYLAIQLAISVASLNAKKVLFFSNESTLSLLTQVVDSIDPQFIKSSSGELYIDEFAFNFEAIVNTVNSFDTNDLGLVVIDSFQPLYFMGIADGEQRTNKIVAHLKHLARNCKVPILLTTNVNRGITVRDDKRPNCLDIRDSYSIEQVADKVVFLYRDEIYNADTLLKNKTEVIIAKNRFGQTGRFWIELVGNKFVQV